MLKHWPQLNYLRGFEAAARLGSFHKAAKALNLTQSAISQQIRTLESYLGQSLFSRQGRSISLTDAGRDLLTTTQALLAQLAAGIRRLDQYRKPNQLVINTPPAFACHWLVPRLADFRQRHPDVDVWLFTSDIAPDMASQTIDIAIRDDISAQPECSFRILHRDHLFPACHPAVMALPPNERTTLHGEREMDWSHWQTAGGSDVGQNRNGLNFSDPGVLLDAARKGLGIALVSELLSRRALASGELQRLSDSTIHGPSWAWLIQQDSENNPMTRRFCDWLLQQLAVNA